MGSISSSPFLLKKNVKNSFQKILNTLRCDIIMWHGDVIFYNKITSQIHVRPACGCSFVFYLSHGLAWLVLGRLIISLYEGGIEKSVLRSACSVGLYQCSIYYINSKRVSVFISEALPGVFGEQRPNFKGNRGTKTILGNREHKKTNFQFFGNRGTSQFISGEQGSRYPPGRASSVF